MAAEVESDGVATSTAGLERAGRTIALGIVVAAVIMAIAASWQPSPPRYQAVAMGDHVIRLDTKSGSMMSCDGKQCVSILKHGHEGWSHQYQFPAPSNGTGNSR